MCIFRSGATESKIMPQTFWQQVTSVKDDKSNSIPQMLGFTERKIERALSPQQFWRNALPGPLYAYQVRPFGRPRIVCGWAFCHLCVGLLSSVCWSHISVGLLLRASPYRSRYTPGQPEPRSKSQSDRTCEPKTCIVIAYTCKYINRSYSESDNFLSRRFACFLEVCA